MATKEDPPIVIPDKINSDILIEEVTSIGPRGDGRYAGLDKYIALVEKKGYEVEVTREEFHEAFSNLGKDLYPSDFAKVRSLVKVPTLPIEDVPMHLGDGNLFDSSIAKRRLENVV
jgi:hypothetical protein